MSDFLAKLRERRAEVNKTVVQYGVSFMDDATGGIGAGELVIIGAATGAGKTETLSAIAQNVAKTDRVCFYALEAHDLEIQERILYRMVSDAYFGLEVGRRPKLATGFLNFYDYHRGFYGNALDAIENQILPEFERVTKNITFIYPTEVQPELLSLDVEARIQDGYALFVVDHLHALEYGADELDGIKRALRVCDRIVNHKRTAMIMASHLRKGDKFQRGFPDLNELHGSSEISKKATGVFLIGAHTGGGFGAEDHEIPTIIHAGKFRLDGGVKAWFGLHKFDIRARRFSSNYVLMKRGFNDRGKEVFDAFQGAKPIWAKRGLILRKDGTTGC